jgi:pyridoxamine 5'-phosphate oxidase
MHTNYGVEEADAAADPVTQFRTWLAEAAEREVYEPNSMVVGTIDPDGAPSVETPRKLWA